MKYLRIVFLFALALFCGSVACHGSSNFHVGVVDPNSCGPDPSACNIVDINGPITGFTFQTAACNENVPTSGGTPFCVDLFNQTNSDIGSIIITIPDSALGGQTPICDTTTSFAGSCTMSGGIDTFSFTNGSFAPGGVEDIYVYGLTDPTALNGATVTVAATPEPDSLLLLSTGVMMAGLYMAKRPLISAFGKK